MFCWEVWLELKELKPDPGRCELGFSYAQWQSLSYGGRGGAGAQVTGAEALWELHFSQVCWLFQPLFGTWLGTKGLVLHFCAGYTYSLVCVT